MAEEETGIFENFMEYLIKIVLFIMLLGAVYFLLKRLGVMG